MISRRLDAQGMAITLALGFLVVVLVIAAGVHSLVVGQLRASSSQRRRVAAEYLAQGGVARTIGWFNSQGYQLPQFSTLTATVPVKLTSNNAMVVLPSNHPDSYTDQYGQACNNMVTSYTTYLNSQSTSVGTFTVTASLMNRQPETWELLATGESGGVTRQVGALLVRQHEPLFGDALFGRDRATLNGNPYTDSYDSTVGPYGGANRFDTGNVRSNGPITLNGNSTVGGDAVPGPNDAVTLNGNSSVTGSTQPAKAPKTLPASVIPGNAINLGNVSLRANQTQTVAAGTYRLGELSITGNAQLIIDASAGPVTLYVTGKISIGGNGIANSSGLPRNLSIVQVGGSSVSFSGNANFYGTVYAPDSSLALNGNGEMFGAFAGASLAQNGNAAFHYDQYLRNILGPPGPMLLVSQWTVPG